MQQHSERRYSEADTVQHRDLPLLSVALVKKEGWQDANARRAPDPWTEDPSVRSRTRSPQTGVAISCRRLLTHPSDDQTFTAAPLDPFSFDVLRRFGRGTRTASIGFSILPNPNDDVGVTMSRRRFLTCRSDGQSFTVPPLSLFSSEKTDPLRHRIRTRSFGFSISGPP